MRLAVTVLMPLCAVIFSACARYPGMFYTEHTQFGLQVKVNPRENKPVDVNMGYDRGIFTIVPRTGKGKDASSVISKTDLCVRLVDSSVIRNVFASGEAANNITEDKEKGARIEALFHVIDSAKPEAPPGSGNCE